MSNKQISRELAKRLTQQQLDEYARANDVALITDISTSVINHIAKRLETDKIKREEEIYLLYDQIAALTTARYAPQVPLKQGQLLEGLLTFVSSTVYALDTNLTILKKHTNDQEALKHAKGGQA